MLCDQALRGPGVVLLERWPSQVSSSNAPLSFVWGSTKKVGWEYMTCYRCAMVALGVESFNLGSRSLSMGWGTGYRGSPLVSRGRVRQDVVGCWCVLLTSCRKHSVVYWEEKLNESTLQFWYTKCCPDFHSQMPLQFQYLPKSRLSLECSPKCDYYVRTWSSKTTPHCCQYCIQIIQLNKVSKKEAWFCKKQNC